MPHIISIHEYTLKPDVEAAAFERAVKRAREQGLLQIPGLSEFHFLKGVKGTRRGQYAALWVYESREAWESVWGPPERSKSKAEYPRNWQIWEDEVLAPYLVSDPDRIVFTAYETF